MDDELDSDQLISDIRLLKEALAEDIDEDEEGDDWRSDHGEDEEETVASSLLNLDKYNLEELLNGDVGTGFDGEQLSLPTLGLNHNQPHLNWQSNLKKKKPGANNVHLQGVNHFQQDEKPMSCFDTDVSVSGAQQGTDVVQACLRLNLGYQEVLQKQLDQIEIAVEKIHQLRAELDCLSHPNGLPEESKSLRPKSFSKPYFKDRQGAGPPDNVDGRGINVVWSDQLNEHRPKRWKPDEICALKDDVRSQILEMKTTNLMQQLKEIHDHSTTDVDNEDLRHTACTIEAEIEQIRSLPDDELLLPLDGIDWQRVAQMVGSRSACDCMSHWTMVEHPRVNKGPWTSDEDKQLVKLAKKYKERNWCGIAEQLQTNRTPAACLARYHSALNRNFTRKDWTNEEDKLLQEAVAVYGESSWQLVAEYVGERTGQQCLFRWTKSIDPRLKKGKWSAKEDKALNKAVSRYGIGRWAKISSAVPGRTDSQCRERYMNVLDPSLKHGEWSVEEDTRLMAVVHELGPGKWSEVAKRVGFRTDSSCWRRWARLSNPTQVENYLVTSLQRRHSVIQQTGENNNADGFDEDLLSVEFLKAKGKVSRISHQLSGQSSSAPTTRKRPRRHNRYDSTEWDTSDDNYENENEENICECTTDKESNGQGGHDSDPEYRPFVTEVSGVGTKRHCIVMDNKHKGVRNENGDNLAGCGQALDENGQSSGNSDHVEDEEQVDQEDDQHSEMEEAEREFSVSNNLLVPLQPHVVKEAPSLAPLSLMLQIFDINSHSILQQYQQSQNSLVVTASEVSNLSCLPPCLATLRALRALLLNRGRLIVSAQRVRSEEMSSGVAAGEAACSKTVAERTFPQTVRESVEYQLLAARFRTLFMWPALLSGLSVTSVTKKHTKTDKPTETASN